MDRRSWDSGHLTDTDSDNCRAYILDNVIKKAELYLLIAGVVLCAVTLSDRAWDRALTIRHIIWAVVTLILFVSVMARAVSKPQTVNFNIVTGLPFIAFASYLAATIMSGFFAVNGGEWLYETLKIFVMLVYLFAAAVIIADNDDLTRALVLLALGLGIYGACQYVDWYTAAGHLDDPMECIGTMCHKNLWVGAQLLLLPFCYRAIVRLGKFWKTAAFVAGAVIVFNIFVIFTRSVVLALIVVAVTASLFDRKLFLCTVAGLLVCGWLAFVFKGHLLTHGQTLGHRWQLWEQSVIHFLPFGVGAGNWRIAIPQYACNMTIPNAFISVFYQRPHNDYVWVLCETGIAGLFFYLCMFSTAIYQAARDKKVYVVMGMVGYMVFAFFSFPKERCFHSVMLMVFIALTAKNVNYKLYLPRAKTILMITAVVVPILIFAVVDFCFRYRSDCSVRRMRTGTYTWQAFIDEVDDKSTPFCTIDATAMPIKWYSGVAYAKVGINFNAMRDFKKAYKANPNHAEVLNNLGSCLALAGDANSAEKILKKVTTMHPKYEPAKINLEVLRNEVKK